MCAARSGPLAMHDANELVIATPASDPRLPSEFVGAVAFATTLFVSSILVAAGSHVSSDVALVAMAGTVGLVAWWSRPPAAAIPAACGSLMLNGFVVNRAGSLHWHGGADVARLAVLFGVAAGASLTRAALIRLTRAVAIDEFPTESYPSGSGAAASGPIPAVRSAPSIPESDHPFARRGDRHA